MFQRKKLRLEILKNSERSSVKYFIQDQMAVLLTIVGGIPIFFEYFGLISPPETIPDPALRAVSITSLLICTIIILFIYSERRQFVRERKIYSAALGLLLMIGGLVLLVVYTYKPTADELLAKMKSNAYEVYIFSAGGAIPGTAKSVPLEITPFWFLLAIMATVVWLSIVLFLIFKIDSLIKKVNFAEPEPHVEGEEKRQSGTWLRPVRRILVPVAQVVVFLLFIPITLILFDPVFAEIHVVETIIISVRKVNFMRTAAYVAYYPLLVTGSMLMITVVFNSFERQRSFYENINQLGDPFFEEIDKITESISQFENWFNDRERESRERFLLHDQQKPSDKRRVALDDLNAQENQRIFYWRAMRAKLTYYRQRIEEFAASDGRQLHASGPLIDDIFTKCMPTGDQSLREFKAVSSGDLTFWRRRGEEYLSWNIDMLNAGLKVTRIFVLNQKSPFHDFVEDDIKKERLKRVTEQIFTKTERRDDSAIDFKEVTEMDSTKIDLEEKSLLEWETEVFRITVDNMRVLFRQVALGIRVYICFDHDLKASDGTKFGLNRQDFGVYPGFAVSFFGKPLRIGGRSLLMAFDQEIIADFNEHYENILAKIRNQACKELDDQLLSIKEENKDNLVTITNSRLDALEAFLIANMSISPNLIKFVREDINFK